MKKLLLIIPVLLIVLAVYTSAAITLSPDLIHYYPFNEGYGNESEDRGVKAPAYNVTIVQTYLNIWRNDSVIFGNGLNAQGSSFEPNGTFTKIYTPIDNRYLGDRSYTISTWFKTDSNANEGALFGKYWSSAAWINIGWLDDVNNMSVHAKDSGAGVAEWRVGTPYSAYLDSQWHNYVIVRYAASDNMSIFIDGEYMTSTIAENALFPVDSGNLHFGERDNGGVHTGFEGRIGEIKMFNISLTNSEIASIYTYGNIYNESEYNITYNFSFRDEEINEPILLNGTANIIPLSGQPRYDNFSIVDGYVNFTLYNANELGDYRIDYSFTDFRQRSHYYTVTAGQALTQINTVLYSINDTDSSVINLNVNDESGNDLSNVTVRLYRYYANESGYIIVEMTRTDDGGGAVLSVVPNEQWYYLSFEYEGIVRLITNPLKFTQASYFYQLFLTADFASDLTSFIGIITNVTYSNASGNARFTYEDPRSRIDNACLLVRRVRLGDYATICDNCSSAASGTILCYVNESAQVNGTYVVDGYLYINSTKYAAGHDEFTIGRNWATMGLPLFLAGFMIASFALVGAYFPVASIILTLMATAWAAFMGLAWMSYTGVVSLIIVGLIVVFRGGKSLR